MGMSISNTNNYTMVDRLQFSLGDHEKAGFLKTLKIMFNNLTKTTPKDLDKPRDRELLAKTAVDAYVAEIRKNPAMRLDSFANDLRKAIIFSNKIKSNDKNIDITLTLAVEQIKVQLGSQEDLKKTHIREKSSLQFDNLYKSDEDFSLVYDLKGIIDRLDNPSDISSLPIQQFIARELAEIALERGLDSGSAQDSFIRKAIELIHEDPRVETKEGFDQYISAQFKTYANMDLENNAFEMQFEDDLMGMHMTNFFLNLLGNENENTKVQLESSDDTEVKLEPELKSSDDKEIVVEFDNNIVQIESDQVEHS